MKLSFLGATETVTGSKYLIENSQSRFLIDCGLFQGYKPLRLRNWEPFPVPVSTIQAVILTHAHLDHSGYLPLLVKQGFKGFIYSSASTKKLCEILLRDAGRIQEEDARTANKYGYSKHAPALPLYTEEDANRALTFFKTVQFDKITPLTKEMSFKLSRSGHILGSSFVTLTTNTSSIVFSGDIGRPHDPIMKHPVTITGADYLIMESTYGNRLHSKANVLDQLEEIIKSTIAKRGKVIIPSFAVGRAQSVLYYIYRLRSEGRIPKNIPVFLDSPMAQDATDLWCNSIPEHALPEDVCKGVCSISKYTQRREDSKRLNDFEGPAIIISSSGMAEGGRVLYHIANYAPKPENTILFSGYQAGGSRGRQMIDGEKQVKIHGAYIPIRARIENLDNLSSHADYEEILEWLKGFTSPPKQVFITHGELDAAESLKQKIEQAFGWKVTVPHYLESFDLS